MTLASLTFDPKAFDPAEAPADARALNAAIVARLANWDNFGRPLPETREMRRQGQGPFPAPVFSPRAVTQTIDGPHGPIPLRIIAPAAPRGVYLHIHGGGWVLGTSDSQDMRLERLVDRTGLAVVSVDYRKAPEHPYPMGPDDCEAAALWLTGASLQQFGTDRLAIGGESAGAHLSVVTLVRLKQRHAIMPFAAANLHAGCYDLALTPSVRAWGDEKLVLNTRDIQLFVKHFLVRGGDVGHPDVSPIHADLTGLPPALFTVGTRDPLVDDSLFMAAKWAAGGNRAELQAYPGGCHVFVAFPGTNTEHCLTRQETFLSSALLD